MNLNWSHVQDDVKDLIEDSAPARHLLKAIKLTSIQQQSDSCTIQLSVENKLTLQMCERLFLPQLKHVIEARLGFPVTFLFSIQSSQEPFLLAEAEEDEPTSCVDPEISSAAEAQPRFDFKNKYSLSPRYQYSNFCETEENKYAKLATEHFVADSTLDLSVMVLTGPSGTGKTHLLNATGWNFLKIKPHLKIKLISGDDLISDFQSAIQRRTMNEFRLKYRLETDILLIDDIHCLERAKATQTELFNLINEFQNGGQNPNKIKKIILTCDRPIESIVGFDERLKSRLLGSLHVELDYPSLHAKQLIFNFKLQEAQIALGPEIIERIITGAGPCIRSLEGALNRLQMLRRTSGHLDPLVLNKMFPKMVGNDSLAKNLNVDILLIKICNTFQITLKDLKGTSRKQNLVKARRACAQALQAELGKTTADIGRILQRDHSTVSSLLRSSTVTIAE